MKTSSKSDRGTREPLDLSPPKVPFTVIWAERFFELRGIRSRKMQVSQGLRRIAPALFLTIMLPLLAMSRIRQFVKKAVGIKPSIVYGPTPIVNIIHNSELDRRLGFRSETLVYTTYFITNRFTYSLKEKMSVAWLAPFIPYLCFIFAFLRYDIFHHYYDWGFLDWANVTPGTRGIEYRLLKWGGKKIIFSAYGADVRVRDITLPWGLSGCSECPPDEIGRHCICDANKARSNYELKSRYATALLSMGDMTAYTPGSENGIFYWPIDTDKWPYAGVPVTSPDDPLIVVHAPNHPHFKGSRFLFKAIEELKSEGLNIDLRVVQGLSNEEAQKVYSQAHIVAAQFVVGWHGYFEIESMALGKPTMVFIRDKRWLLAPEECPLINTSADEIANTLRYYYKNRARLSEIGRQSRQYVEKYYSFEAASKRFTDLYDRVW